MRNSEATPLLQEHDGDRELHSHAALAQFESKLAPRTKVPQDRLREFFGWSPEKVRRESEIVTQILRRFAEAVVDAIDEPDRADQFLQALDLKAISRDHEWRTIFSTLRSQDADCGEYQRAVLIKYLQYLSFRKRLLDYILSKKQGLQETNEISSLTLYPDPPEELEDSPLFEAPTVIRNERSGEAFVRMNMGENIELKLEDGERIDLRLANHEFRLVGANPPCLVDENGVMYFLRPGRNLIGRHPESDVPIDANFGHVSRAHMIIEWEADGCVHLIDLSSRGTFLRREVLQRGQTLDT